MNGTNIDGKYLNHFCFVDNITAIKKTKTQLQKMMFRRNSEECRVKNKPGQNKVSENIKKTTLI